MLPLDRCVGVAEAGGKAETLARMRAAGLRVADGVVLLPDEAVDAAELAQALARLGGERFVVRSSASLEDRADATAAGVFESRVAHAADVAAAVAAVRASADGPAVRAYRAARGTAEAVRMAVLVQPWVAAERYGVAHSAAPEAAFAGGSVSARAAAATDRAMARSGAPTGREDGARTGREDGARTGREDGARTGHEDGARTGRGDVAGDGVLVGEDAAANRKDGARTGREDGARTGRGDVAGDGALVGEDAATNRKDGARAGRQDGARTGRGDADGDDALVGDDAAAGPGARADGRERVRDAAVAIEGAATGDDMRAGGAAIANEAAFVGDGANSNRAGRADGGAFADAAEDANEGTVVGDGAGANEGAVAGDGAGANEGAVAGDDVGANEGAVAGDDAGANKGALVGDGAGANEGTLDGDGAGANEGALIGDDAVASEAAVAGDDAGANEGARGGSGVRADDRSRAAGAAADDAALASEGALANGGALAGERARVGRAPFAGDRAFANGAASAGGDAAGAVDGAFAVEERAPGEPEWGDVVASHVARGDAGALATGMRALETLLGGPVDAEFARSGTQVTWLQARPLVRPQARLQAQSPPAALSERGRWTRDAEHNPDPLSPAQASLVAYVDTLGVGARQRVVGGYLYVERGAPPRGLQPVALDELRQRFDDEIVPCSRRRLTAAEHDGDLAAALSAYGYVYRRYVGEVSPTLKAARAALDDLLRRVFGEPLAAHGDLLGGLGGATVARDQALWELGAVDANNEPAAGRAAAVDDYLARFGDHAPAWDVAVATDAESGRWRALARQLRRSPESPVARQSQARAQAKAAAATLTARVPPSLRAELTNALATARALLPIAEDDDLLFLAAQATVRRAILRRARQLSVAPADAFYLTFDELQAPPGDMMTRVARRRDEQTAQRANVPPAAYDDGVPSWPAPSSRAVLRGAATAGRARGRAFVVHALDTAPTTLPPGVVLVAPALTPSLAPLLPAARALVTDHGGALSHGATLAREYGVPAVLGCGSATTLLRDGSDIYVDGAAGRVYPLANEIDATDVDATDVDASGVPPTDVDATDVDASDVPPTDVNASDLPPTSDNRGG